MKRNGTIKVLLAKPGLDGHDVGAKIIARALIAAGFDVAYTGLKKSPEEIVHRVEDDKIDVLGLSILSGSHIPVCSRIGELLRAKGLDDVLWIVGGNIPQGDHDTLKKLGVSEVFSVGSSLDSIVDFIHEKTS